MRTGFVLGVLVTVVVGLLGAAVVIWSGFIDVSATGANAAVDRVLAYTSSRSIRHHAQSGPNPEANNPAALEVGLTHYREMCVDCHGGPGVEPEEFAGGLHPAAPDLASKGVQSFTDGMLYNVIANGIGSTGMPAFGKSHTPQQIWSIVSFIRALPHLTPAQKAALGKEAQEQPGPASPPEQPPADPAPSQPPAQAAQPHASKVKKVTFSNMHFVPSTLEVHVGDTVVFENTDFVAHTATAQDGTFDTKKIDGGQSKSIRVRKPGTFPYYCRYHQGMTGTLIVKP